MSIRMFNMTCLFENTKLCLLGYYSCCWAVYPTLIRSVDFSRFKETCQNALRFSEKFHNLKQEFNNTFPQVCVRGEGAHSDPRFGEAKPKEFRGLALFGQAESWGILPCMKIWQDFLKWFDLLAVLEYSFFFFFWFYVGISFNDDIIYEFMTLFLICYDT